MSENETAFNRVISRVAPIFSSNMARKIFAKLKRGARFTWPRCLFVSGKNIAVRITAIRDIDPAIINGKEAEYDTVKADMAGPKIKPKPKEAPIMPKPLALCSWVVVSEMTAEATGILPAVMPSRARAIKRNQKLGAKAIIKKDIAVPRIEKINMGLLPYLSDIRPIIGVARN